MSGIGINYLDNNTSVINTKLNNHKEIKEQVILNADKVEKNIPEKDIFRSDLIETKSLNEIKTEFSFIDINTSKAETLKSEAKANITDYNSDKHVSGKNADFFYINGIMTDPEGAKKTAGILSEIIGKPVNSLWSKKEGFVGDLIKAVKIDQANNAGSFSSETAPEITTRVLYSLRTGKNVKLITHSRGASETANALWDVRSSLALSGRSDENINKMMSRIEVITMGGLASASDFPSDVKLTQIKNPDDPVPDLNRDKKNSTRSRYSEVENQIKSKTFYNNNKPLNYDQRFSIYKDSLYFPKDISSIVSNMQSKISTGLLVLESKAMLTIASDKQKSYAFSTLPILCVPEVAYVAISHVIASKIKEIVSSHLVNAGSNNYLGEKSVQDELKKLAN